ncbi:MAG: glycosyltransferase family 4 protein, partial [Pseudomonadota bacterium]
LPVEILREAQGPLAALIHHPLALEHGLDADQAGALAVQERAALAECGAVITTSSHTAETLIAEFGVSREAITVARPGIPRPEPFVGRVEVNDNVKILSVGTLTSRKGHDILIEALAQHRHLPWQLTILGDDTREPDYTADLHRRVDRHGLNERISFRGVVESYSLARSFATADLFVLASRYEGYGMAFAEAMAAGLPVLGTDAGAVSEATAGGAMLVPPDDVVALSEALGPLLADAGARAALAARSRSAARTLATWDDTAAAVTQALMPLTAAQAAVGAPPPPADTALETGR